MLSNNSYKNTSIHNDSPSETNNRKDQQAYTMILHQRQITEKTTHLIWHKDVNVKTKSANGKQ